ncbi:MAG: hypothetical protein WAZ60_24035 [Desulfosalsimonadaceae bacterium]
MSERVLTVGGSRASKPLSDFLMSNEYFGPKAGVYYVDLNVAATGGGSPDHPFATIAEAITASNASIGLAANRWWARRNRIFVCGDGITENLTVLPEKCDIIGCGSDLVPYPRIIGHHTIALAKVGCRLINLGFLVDGTGVGITIPAGCHGFQILGGMMQASNAGNTVGIQITDSALFKIQGFEIHQSPTTYATGIFAVGIAVAGVASTHQFLIDDCFVEATEGIDVVASSPAYGSRISNNTVKATALTIDENSDTVMVINNRLITAANIGTTTDGYNFNLALAAGNILTGLNGVAATIPFAVVAE